MGACKGCSGSIRGDEELLLLSGSSDDFSYLLTAGVRGNERTKAEWTVLLPAPFRHAGGFQIVDGRYPAVGLEDNQAKNVSKE